MRRLLPLFAIAIAAFTASLSPASAQQTQYFSQPTVQGIPVSHCEAGLSNCGRGGAAAFCQSKGFRRAESWKTYTTQRSVTLRDGRLCDGGGCVALNNVTCAGPEGRGKRRDTAVVPQNIGATERFQEPEFQGYAVDQCTGLGRGCGQEGADLYCQSVGYERAKSYETRVVNETVLLAEGRVCRDGTCNALRRVICTRDGGAVAAYDPPRIDRNRSDGRRRGENNNRADGRRRDNDNNRGERRRDRRETAERDRPIIADGGSRTYSYPRVSGLAVDHCERFGTNCGRAGADQLAARKAMTPRPIGRHSALARRTTSVPGALVTTAIAPALAPSPASAAALPPPRHRQPTVRARHSAFQNSKARRSITARPGAAIADAAARTSFAVRRASSVPSAGIPTRSARPS